MCGDTYGVYFIRGKGEGGGLEKGLIMNPDSTSELKRLLTATGSLKAESRFLREDVGILIMPVWKFLSSWKASSPAKADT